MKNYRPIHHISASHGWINDPNGFCYYDGKYHIFAQYNPYKCEWGPMHWLHFTSLDLLTWKEEGIALYPDQPYDKENGCFSGSIITQGDLVRIYYTSATKDKQTQSIADLKDGNFIKFIDNPILDETHLPNGYLSSDFRDPKVSIHKDQFYMLAVSKNTAGNTSILLFKSSDGIHFEFKNILKEFTAPAVVECPDIIFEKDKCVLIFSLQNPNKFIYSKKFTIGYQIGYFDFDKCSFLPITEEREPDKGFDSYASQTLTKDNKHYITYWMSSWDNKVVTSFEGYAGQLGLFKEAKIVNNELRLLFLKNQKTTKIKQKFRTNIEEIDLDNIKIIFNKKNKTVSVSRFNMDSDTNGINEKTFVLKEMAEIDLEYHLDNSCVELSFNHGEVFFSMLNFYKNNGENND